jgi:hypothetical protein
VDEHRVGEGPAHIDADQSGFAGVGGGLYHGRRLYRDPGAPPVRPARITLLVALAAATATPLASAAPAAAPTAPVRNLSPGPPNATFAAGLAGWSVQGRLAPELVGRGAAAYVRLKGNPTLVSAPLAVPGRAQAIRIVARSPGRGGVLVVRARPVRGGPERVLGTIAPGDGFAGYSVQAGPIRGTTVRLVLDPVTGLGRSVDVRRVGPVQELLRGWLVSRGLPRRTRIGRRAAVLVQGQALVMAATPFPVPPNARALLVSLRGAGGVEARAGARVVRVAARGRWRTVKVPIRGGARQVSLRLRVRPGAGGVALRDLAVVEQAPRR